MRTRGCLCNMVDIGVGEIREPNPECPEHAESDARTEALLPALPSDETPMGWRNRALAIALGLKGPQG